MAHAPAPTPSAATGSTPPPGGQQVCRVSDTRLAEISGLAAVADGYVVVNDSNLEPSRIKIFYIDTQCKVKKQVDYGSTARDPEDVAVQPDGTVWAADIGDNTSLTGGSGEKRSSIALWKLAPNSTKAIIHRVTYPDNKQHDAEALLVKPDGTPIIITKESPAQLFEPSAALVPNSATGVPLKKVGEFKPAATGTVNRFGPVGEAVITGAATSADGKKVLLRTYAAAYEFDVPDGDVVKAITTGKPRATPLPNELQGEAITFSLDGASYLTISDGPVPQPLLKYTPATAPVAKPSGQSVPSPAAASGSWLSDLSLQQLKYVVAAVGAIGLLFVIAGIIGIRQSRRSRRAAAPVGPVRGSATVGIDDDDDPPPTSRWSGGPAAGAGGARGGPGGPRGGRGGSSDDMYRPGYGAGDDAQASGRVYGRSGPPAAEPAGGRSGTVYGGGPAPAPDYERGGYGDRPDYRRPESDYRRSGYERPDSDRDRDRSSGSNSGRGRVQQQGGRGMYGGYEPAGQRGGESPQEHEGYGRR